MTKTQIEKKIEKLSEHNFQLIAESEQYAEAYRKYTSIWEQIENNKNQIQVLKQKGGIENTLPEVLLDHYRSESKAIAL